MKEETIPKVKSIISVVVCLLVYMSIIKTIIRFVRAKTHHLIRNYQLEHSKSSTILPTIQAGKKKKHVF